MNEVTTTKERILEAASKCSTAKNVLTTLFPEVFVETESQKLHENNNKSIEKAKIYLINIITETLTDHKIQMLAYNGFDSFYEKFAAFCNAEIKKKEDDDLPF